MLGWLLNLGFAGGALMAIGQDEIVTFVAEIQQDEGFVAEIQQTESFGADTL